MASSTSYIKRTIHQWCRTKLQSRMPPAPATTSPAAGRRAHQTRGHAQPQALHQPATLPDPERRPIGPQHHLTAIEASQCHDFAEALGPIRVGGRTFPAASAAVRYMDGPVGASHLARDTLCHWGRQPARAVGALALTAAPACCHKPPPQDIRLTCLVGSE